MKVLITAPSLNVKQNVSGISSVVNTIIKNNVDVDYLHFISGKRDEEKGGISRIIPLIKSYFNLYSISKKNSYDIMHLNLALNKKSLIRDYVVFKIALKCKKRIVTHLHGGEFLIKRPTGNFLPKLINNVLQKSDAVVVLSEYEKDIIIKYYNVDEVKVLANTVEPEYLKRDHERPSPGDGIKFLFLGRLHESKGMKHILEAFNIYIKRNYKGSLDICGAGPLEQDVQDAVKANPNIKYHGIVYGEDKLKYIHQSDVFLLPSLHGEGLPVALLETMATGLVPIVTTDGSMGKVVLDNFNGLIVEKADSEGLVKKMCLLSDNRELWAQLSENSRNYIQKNFDVKGYVKDLNNIYSAIS